MTKLLLGDFSKLPLLVKKKVGKEPLFSPNSGRDMLLIGVNPLN